MGISYVTYAQSSFSDTLNSDQTSNWEVISSFEFTLDESIVLPIAYLYTDQDGNAIKFAKTSRNGDLQVSNILTDINVCGFSHYLTEEVIVKVANNRLIFPLIRELDTINFSGDSTRLYFLKTDTMGNHLDSLLFDIPNGGNYDFKDSYVDSDSTFLLLGAIKQNNNTHLDILLTRIDTNFNVLWEKRFGDVEEDIGLSLSKLSNGGYLIGGLHELPDGFNKNSSIIKTDVEGNLLWQKYYGKPNYYHDGGMISVLDNDEFVMLSRHWRDGEPHSDLLLTKFNAQGDSLWSVLYQKSNETEYPFDPPIILDNGDMILPALYYDSLTTNSPNGGTIGWILKTDSLGVILWEQDLNLFADSNSLQFVSYNNYSHIKKSNDNGFVLSGRLSRTNHSGQEIYGLITKLDSNGCVLSECANYTGINIIREDNFDIVFYPNPSTGIYYLKSDSKVESISINLYNVSGILILSKDLSSGDYLDLRDYPSGFYVYLCNDGNGNISSGKILFSK